MRGTSGKNVTLTKSRDGDLPTNTLTVIILRRTQGVSSCQGRMNDSMKSPSSYLSPTTLPIDPTNVASKPMLTNPSSSFGALLLIREVFTPSITIIPIKIADNEVKYTKTPAPQSLCKERRSELLSIDKKMANYRK